LTPSPPKGADVLGWDKLNHGAAFAALAAAATLGFRHFLNHRLIIAAGLMAYGAGIEIAQMWVPSRSAEWGDLLADGLGVSLGLLVAGALLRQLNSRH
jgi:VanZ family protein